MSHYRIVDFFHRSELKRTVWYGPEGPPSALTAIYNYCALTFMDFKVCQVPEYVEVEDLKEALKVLVNGIFATLRNAEDYTVEQLNAHQDLMEQQINCMDSSAVVLQPHPGSVDLFQKNSFIWIAGCLGIRLKHGWLCNPDEHPYIRPEGVTYEFLQEFLSKLNFSDLANPDVAKKCKFIEDFLKEADKLCTSYGYLKLCEMPNGSFALYYWNKKLDVIHKNESYLLILETDQGVMDRLPGVTWRVFEEVDDGNSIFLTSDYSLVSNQPNIAKAQLWFKDKGLSKNKVHSIEPAAGKRSVCQEDKAAVTQDVQGDAEQLSASQRKRRNKKLKEKAEDKAAVTQDVQEDVEQLSKSQIKRRNKKLHKQAEEEARRKQRELEEEEAGMKQKKEEAGSKRAEEEEARRKQAEEEEARRKQAEEEEARRKQAELEESGRKQAKEEEAGRKQAKEEEAGRKQAEEEERKKISAICGDFDHFLLVFQDDGSEMPYFRGVAESIKFTGSPNFYVPYEFIESHDKALALKIQDNYPRISEILNQRVHEYLSGHKVQKAANLKILHLPSPKSVQPFTDYAAAISLLEVYDVCSSMEESPSFLGRKMALGYLHFIIGKFMEGKCFGGKWDISNMWVTNNGTNFTIDCEDELLSDDGGCADLERFDETILARFLTKQGKFPPYFKELRQDFKLLRECRGSPEKWKRFISLISYPFALKAPLVRSAFICNAYRAAYSLCNGKHDVYAPLHVKGDDWRDHATGHMLLKSVYDYKNFGNGPWTVTYIFTKWGPSYWDLLTFCRHFIEHVLDNSKLVLDNTKDIMQQIQDIMIVDIIMARQLGEFIHCMVRFLVLNCDLDGVFSSAWAHFIGSDCHDKPKENITMGPIKVQDLVSSFSDIESVQHETVVARAEIESNESSPGLQRSFIVGNLDLNDFAEILRKHQRHATCTQENGVMYLRCGPITIYRAYRKKEVNGSWILDKESDPVVTVIGPVCDDYYRIFQLVGLWLSR